MQIARSAFVALLFLAGFAWQSPAQDADPARPAAVETAEVPVIPSEVFERMRQYQDVRTATFQGWSPDGAGMLVATRFGNTNQLHRVYTPGGRREQITFFPEPASGKILPGKSDQDVLVVMSQGGNENDQFYWLDRQASKVTLLTDGKSRNVPGPVQEDGALLVYGSNLRNGRDTDIYVANPRTPGSSRMVMQTNGEFYNLNSLSKDGSKLLINHYVSINETHPALLIVKSGEKQPLPLPNESKNAPGAKVAFGSLAFNQDATKAFVTCDARGEFQQLAEVDLTTGEYRWLSEDIAWDIDALEVDPETGVLAFTANVDGSNELYLYDGQQIRKIETPLGIIAGLEFSPDGSRLGFTLSKPTAPSDAYSIDLQSGDLVQWTYSEAGGLNPERFIAPSRIRFKSFDQREIPAYYFRPKQEDAAARAPVVIYIHGGPEAQYTPLFNGLIQYFAVEQGIAVLAPNVRGSAGYGKTYLTLDNAEKREESVKDIGALLDWIKAQPELDGERVSVMGGSYGGYMVLASLVNFPERIRAGVDIVGIGNFITFLERTQPYRQDLRRAEYGDERDPAMRAHFEKINPSNRVADIRSALLVAHGKNDPRVPFFEAEQMAAQARTQGRPVWTVYANNEGHGFQKKDNRDYLNAAIALFLEAELKK
ncbi:MAG: S9 family peptidase [Planctomycetia bacterium]|nr:S9 family peptidase [Planctomycetia bacterium]